MSRSTPVEGLSACGGHVYLDKWGFTFTIEGQLTSSPSLVTNFDCQWTFNLQRKPKPNTHNALYIKCDKMAIKTANEKCSSYYAINNEIKYEKEFELTLSYITLYSFTGIAMMTNTHIWNSFSIIATLILCFVRAVLTIMCLSTTDQFSIVVLLRLMFWVLMFNVLFLNN